MSTSATTTAGDRARRDAEIYASYVLSGQNVAATVKATGIAASTIRDAIKRHSVRTAEATETPELMPAAEVTPAQGGMLARLAEAAASVPETTENAEITPAAEDAPAKPARKREPKPAAGNGDVLVVYRSTKTRRDAAGRQFGETHEDEAAQIEADRKWWPIGTDRRGSLKGIVYVVNGKVARVRAVVAGGEWGRDEGGRVSVPVTAPLTAEQVAGMLPGLPFGLGSERPAVRGKIREYVRL